MPRPGHFILHSNVMPTVTAGHYELVTTQTGQPFDVAEERTSVVVSSPRYVMPPEQILSTFPPANAEGAFGDRLPQIVLKRRTLPWERNPAEVSAVSSTPWLALVVVAEGEAELSTATPVAQCITPVTPLLEASTDKDVEQAIYLSVTETVVNKVFPCAQDLPLLVHVREVDVNDTELANGDDDGFLAVVLANRLPVFDSATGRSVRYMACLVNIEGQIPRLPPPVPPNDHFHFELAQDWAVVANVMPGPDPYVMGGVDIGDIELPAIEAGGLLDARRRPTGRRRRAPTPAAPANPQLAAQGTQSGAEQVVDIDGSAVMKQASVSGQWASATAQVSAAALDPDAKVLVRDAMGVGFRYPIEVLALEPVYRFPVLAHWSFTTNEGATFETLMQDIDVDLLGAIPERPVDAAPPARPAPELIESGHIGLGHRSRRGDAVRAWYRGPLVPFPTIRPGPAAGLLPIAHSADQIRAIVPDGREDLSLASAFEIGRLLGLSQLSIVSALLRFRNEQFGIGRIHEYIDSITDFEIPPILDAEIDLSRFVAIQMIGDMVKNRIDIIGPRRPVADPGREISVKGDLDAVIAGGLGLDVDVIRKAGTTVGILAAVAQQTVPIANTDGGFKLDEQAIAQLQGSLMAEVQHVAAVAAPPQVILNAPRARSASRRRRGAEPAADARDALDDLIDRASANDAEEVR
jgi:hypothetical protein